MQKSLSTLVRGKSISCKKCQQCVIDSKMELIPWSEKHGTFTVCIDVCILASKVFDETFKIELALIKKNYRTSLQQKK